MLQENENFTINSVTQRSTKVEGNEGELLEKKRVSNNQNVFVNYV